MLIGVPKHAVAAPTLCRDYSDKNLYPKYIESLELAQGDVGGRADSGHAGGLFLSRTLRNWIRSIWKEGIGLSMRPLMKSYTILSG